MIASTTLLARRLGWKKVERSGRPARTRTALLSTFTVDPIAPYLGMAMEEANLAPTFFVAPFGQVTSEFLDPTSATARFRPDLVVAWPSLEDLWAGGALPLDGALDGYVEPLVEMAAVAAAAAAKWSAMLVFVLPALPMVRPLGVGDATNPLGVAAAAYAAREAARVALTIHTGVLVADAEDVVRGLATGATFDPRRWYSARIPWSEVAFSILAEQVARLVSLARFGARKVVVVDADNTLWGGVVGEVGPERVDILDNGPGEAYRGFQQYLIELRRAGLVLALASKNNEPEVWRAFGRREMVLRQEHLSAWRVNWKPKAENIDDMVAEFNLGLESVVFIDDSPMERDSVVSALPGVRAVAFPEDPSDWIAMITKDGFLDRLPPTTDDLTRANSYGAERQRRVARSTLTHEQYLDTLRLEVAMFMPAPDDLARLAQLVAKTNQFTLHQPRHSEATLAAMIRDPSIAVRIVAARDRFGDYGVVGAFVVVGRKLDTFVLSCRAMGRGVEVAMLTAAGKLAGGPIDVQVEVGARNAPAREFFAIHRVVDGVTDGAATDGRRISVLAPSWPKHVSSFGGLTW